MKSSFTIYGMTLHPYTFLMVGGGLVCFLMFFFITLRRHAETFDENLFALAALAVSFGVAIPCAMVLEALFKIQQNGGFKIQGSTFYGGLISAVITFTVIIACRKKRKVPIYARLNDLAPCIPAGHCLGRIGCFLSGCCFGSPTDSIFGVVFPEGSEPYKYYLETTGNGSVAIHPTQLYEAAALLVLSVVLLLATKKHSFPLYLMCYAVIRFIIEFLRADNRGNILNMAISPAQFISILLFIAGAALLVWQFILWKKKIPPTVRQKRARVARMCHRQSVKIKRKTAH